MAVPSYSPFHWRDRKLFSGPFIYFHLLCTSEPDHISHVVWQGLQGYPQLFRREGEMTAEKLLSIIQSPTSEVCSTLVLSAIWPVPSQPAVQGSPGELREKLPGETEMGLRREGGGKTRLLRLRNTLFLKLAIFFDELSGSELWSKSMELIMFSSWKVNCVFDTPYLLSNLALKKKEKILWARSLGYT